MKYLNRHILIWLFLFYGTGSYASHVLGGEILYKHIKNNQYRVTLNIYRDCNGCKINGNGGGTSSENCSEIDYLYVKGTDKTSAKETKFALKREIIKDISPLCRSKISTCKGGSNSIYGIELQQFSAVVDLDDSRINGFCDYYLYISLAERNSSITTGQAKQNFCIDAYIQTCNNNKNNSPGFTSAPIFIVNNGKPQYQSSFAADEDNDSLVYSLTPALSGIDKVVSYNTGFSYLNPLTVYCTELAPCIPDRAKETGFYFGRSNGTIVYTPVKNSEIGVVALKVEEYRKISGKWELIGYIKRDIQVYVITGEGNNPPKFLNQDYFEVCEDDQLVIKIESKDERINSSMPYDTVNYSLNSSINGGLFSQSIQSMPPYNYGIFKWTAPKGFSSQGIFTFSVSAKDNFCPLNEISTQIISIKIKPKEDLKISHRDLGCGNFELRSSGISSQSKLNIKIFSTDGLHQEIFKTNLSFDTVSYLPYGKFILSAILTSANGCETQFTDTIYNLSKKTNSSILGSDNVCKDSKYSYTIINLPSAPFNIRWVFNSETIGNGMAVLSNFNKNGTLTSVFTSQKGKWYCSDTLKKEITIIKLPEIISSDKLRICHKSGDLDLKTVKINPSDGIWSSLNPAFNNGIINTNLTLFYYDDTIALNYEITQSGCRSSKNIDLIIQAVPQFELSSTSICEMKNPVRFQYLIKKPYNILDYTYNWDLPLFPDKIKEENGFKLFYPTEIGFGPLEYHGQITAANGCKNYDTAIIEITPAVHINFENEINLCQGSGLINVNDLSGVKPDNGSWSFRDFELFRDRKFVLTDTCGQFEALYVYDNYGCYDSKKVTITIACKPQMQIHGLKNKMCDSELPITLNAVPPGGMWVGDYILGSTFSPPLINKSKSYSLSYLITKDQCNFAETRLVEVLPSPVINFTPDKLNFCKDEPITVTGSIANTDTLSINYFDETFEKNIQGAEDFSSLNLFKSKFDKTLSSQTLLAIATNKEGCYTTKDFFFQVYDTPKIGSMKDTFICENSDYQFTPVINYNGNNDLIYLWYDNTDQIENTKNLYSNKLTVGKHQLTFKTGNGYCNDSKSLNVDIKPTSMVDFIIMPSNTSTIMQPDFSFKNQSEQNQSWLWDFGTKRNDNFSIEESPKYRYKDTGNFTVSLTGTNIHGCSNTIYQTVVVRPDLLIFVPNAFSPNNKDEEKNNVFSVSLENYNNYSIEIFDRWGHKLFYSENPKETWDGKSGNVICTPDVYFYSIKINSITNHLYFYRGTITLIK